MLKREIKRRLKPLLFSCEIIVKGYGILFPHQDYRALASAIRQLCENPEEYRRVAERCQAKAKQYDISLMAKKYNEVYQEICPNL